VIRQGKLVFEDTVAMAVARYGTLEEAFLSITGDALPVEERAA
jgi:hypothetical protein